MGNQATMRFRFFFFAQYRDRPTDPPTHRIYTLVGKFFP